MRPLRIIGVVGVVLLAGCGGGSTVADPAAETSGSVSPSVSPSQGPSPTVGTYPAYDPTDYTYTLSVSCFCLDSGVPIRITVEDGEVTAAVYAGDGRGVEKGQPADTFRWITINDVIDAANDTEAEVVTVRWPEGQDFPDSVSVDKSRQMMDEEIGYALSRVVVTG